MKTFSLHLNLRIQAKVVLISLSVSSPCLASSHAKRSEFCSPVICQGSLGFSHNVSVKQDRLPALQTYLLRDTVTAERRTIFWYMII